MSFTLRELPTTTFSNNIGLVRYLKMKEAVSATVNDSA